jgi:hypothetical protein
MRIKLIALCLVSVFGFAGFAYAGTDATARKSSAIRAEPKAAADEVQALQKGDSLVLGSRKGLWYAVTEPSEGWIKMTDVAIESSGGASPLAALASGRRGSGNTVSSSGARGLDGAAITTGEPNFEAVAELTALSEADTGVGDDFFADQAEREITEPEEDKK